MSKAQSITIVVDNTLQNAKKGIWTSRPTSSSTAVTWANIAAAGGTNVSLFVDTIVTSTGVIPSPACAAQYLQFGRSAVDRFLINRSCFIIDVSSIGRNTEFQPKSISVFLGDNFKPAAQNLASDHSIILAKPGSNLFNQIQSNGLSYNFASSDFFRIEGWIPNADNSGNITPYSDEFDFAAWYAGLSGGIPSPGFSIPLNAEAAKDILNNDFFCFWVLDYDYDVRYRSPKTESPSPGAPSTVVFYPYLIAGPARGVTVTNGLSLTRTQGGIKPTSVTKERIENDFTINSFADITDQRGRLNVNGVIADQVPFLLGTKGPLSLRGREFADDGKPISTTVDPPRTKKDSKS